MSRTAIAVSSAIAARETDPDAEDLLAPTEECSGSTDE